MLPGYVNVKEEGALGLFPPSLRALPSAPHTNTCLAQPISTCTGSTTTRRFTINDLLGQGQAHGQA